MADVRLIDANALKEKLQADHDFYINAWGGFKNLPANDKARVDELTASIAAVVNAPTIDAVEVVRCRECKHARDLPNKSFIACIMWGRAFHSDGFCYMGARMDSKDMDVPTKDGGAEG